MSFSALQIKSDDEDPDPVSRNTLMRGIKKQFRVQRIASGDEEDLKLKDRKNKKRKFTKRQQAQGIVAVDLDGTLIDERKNEFHGADHFIATLAKHFKVVLWTAGNEVHAKMFIEQFPQADKFAKVLYGLHGKTKSVSVIRQQIPITTGPYILIDDSVHNLSTGGYDLPIDVKKYYYVPNIKTEKKIKFINYNALLNDLYERVDDWHASIC